MTKPFLWLIRRMIARVPCTFLVFPGLLVLLPGRVPAEVSQATVCGAQVDTVATLIATRASYMSQVAAAKYLAAKGNQPVLYVPDRELFLLKKVAASARQTGLPPEAATAFAQLQMDLAKQIQAGRILLWQRKLRPAPQVAPDLTRIRAAIVALDRQLYPAIRQALPALSSCPVVQSAEKICVALQAKGVMTGDASADDAVAFFCPVLAAGLSGMVRP